MASADAQTFENARIGHQHFEAGRMIMRKGTTYDIFGTVISGWAIRFHRVPGGQRQIFGFLIPGNHLALESLQFELRPLPFAIQAVTDVQVCWFDLNKMSDLVQTPGKQRERTQDIMHRYTQLLCRRMTAMGRLNARGRLAELLLQISARLHEIGVSLHEMQEMPTQQLLADSVGLTAVHVNRVLGEFRREGIIEMERGAIRILDQDEMKAIARE